MNIQLMRKQDDREVQITTRIADPPCEKRSRHESFDIYSENLSLTEISGLSALSSIRLAVKRVL